MPWATLDELLDKLFFLAASGDGSFLRQNKDLPSLIMF